jgi:carbamoyl-phosphate synthase large subunit
MHPTDSIPLSAPPSAYSREGSAVQVSEEIISNVPLVDVKKVLVVGSGGLSIGQAGEFDYSGKYSFISFITFAFTFFIFRFSSHQSIT